MNRWSHRLLYLLPVCLFVVAVLTSNAQGPYYLGNNVEDYPYLLNSLNLLTFHVPAHVDHPGTTLQTWGAIVILGRWFVSLLFGPWESIQRSVLSRPEDYLHCINLATIFGFATMAFYAGRHLYRLSGSLPAALLLQGGWFLFAETIMATIRVQNEPLMMIAGLALSIPVTTWLFEARAPENGRNYRIGIACGAILAFGVISKITFVPALLFVLLLLITNRERVAVLIAFFCGVALFLLPVYSELPRMSSWFLALATHTGRYGSGSTGLASDHLSATAGSLLKFNSLLFWLLPFYPAVAFANWWERRGDEASETLVRLRRFVYASALGTAAAIAMIASKDSPEARYLVPSMILAVLANVSVALLFANWGSNSILKRLLIAVGVILIVVGLSSTGSSIIAWTRQVTAYRESLANMGLSSGLGLRIGGLETCKVISFYRSSVPTYGLFFGNDYSAEAQRGTLSELYPDAMQFDIFQGRLSRFARAISPSEIRQAIGAGQCFLLQGTRGMESHFKPLQGLTVKAINEGLGWGQGEGVFRLEAAPDFRPPQKELNAPGAVIIEAESFSAGNVEREFKIWGGGIGVIVSPHYPAFAEYHVNLKPGKYMVWLRCAAAESRPLTVLVNGATISTDAASEVTNGWQPTEQMWQAASTVDMNASNVVRLERNLPFPHVDKIAFVPVDSPKDAR